METRWTKPRTDGQPHGNEPCECAHCSHVFPKFDYLEIVRHARFHHREFYRIKWETELASNPQTSQEFAPLPLVPVTIEFVKVWGHPTKNKIYGPPDRARVSDRVAQTLVNGGYAKIIARGPQ